MHAVHGKFLNLEQLRQVERLAANANINLMNRAGEAIANVVLGKFTVPVSIVILIGSGNNGGDGVTAAIKLLQSKYPVTIIQVTEQINEITTTLLTQFIKLGGKTISTIPTNLSQYSVIVDAILGVGVHGKLADNIAHAINLLNKEYAKSLILAVDTPSGLNPFSGEVCGVAVKADITITFLVDKPAFYTGEAANYPGSIIYADLGTSTYYNQVSDKQLPQIVLNQLDNISYSALIRTNKNTHKGTFGTVAILGGGPGMHGALHLSGRAALLMGSGKVVLGALDPLFQADVTMPELITNSSNDVLSNIEVYSVLIVGPGLGNAKAAVNLIHELLLKLTQISTVPKLIFDADALNIIASVTGLHNEFVKITNKVITPHPKEASRLLGLKTAEIENNRFLAVKLLSEKYACTALLKGCGSLIYDNHTTYINQSGNPSLSAAGEGDVLCGIIAGIAAQGIPINDALRFGVYLHGLSADDLVLKSGGFQGILASEVALNSRNLLNQILYK